MNAAADEGFDAYCQGISRNARPYEPGTQEHDEWIRGWDEAEEVAFEESAQGIRR